MKTNLVRILKNTMSVFVCAILICFLGCTEKGAFSNRPQGDAQGISGRNFIATYQNSTPRCKAETLSQRSALRCNIYVLEGESYFLATIAENVLFQWSTPSSTLVDKPTCRTSADSLSFGCDLLSNSAAVSEIKVPVVITDTLTSDTRNEVSPVVVDASANTQSFDIATIADTDTLVGASFIVDAKIVGGTTGISLVASASTNPSLIPLSNITISGTAENRIIRISPVAGVTGTSTLTLTASDGKGVSSSKSFVARVRSMAECRGSGADVGTNGWWSVGNAYGVERSDRLSIGVWYKTLAVGTEGYTMFWNNLNPLQGHRGFYTLLSATGHFGVGLRNVYSAGNAIEVSTSTPVTTLDGNWHHFVATYDGSSSGSGVSIYFDGNKMSTTISEDTLTSTIASSYAITLNGYAMQNALDGLTNGTYGETFIMKNRMLTQEEVKNVYASCNLPVNGGSSTVISMSNVVTHLLNKSTPTNGSIFTDASGLGLAVGFLVQPP